MMQKQVDAMMKMIKIGEDPTPEQQSHMLIALPCLSQKYEWSKVTILLFRVRVRTFIWPKSKWLHICSLVNITLVPTLHKGYKDPVASAATTFTHLKNYIRKQLKVSANKLHR